MAVDAHLCHVSGAYVGDEDRVSLSFKPTALNGTLEINNVT